MAQLSSRYFPSHKLEDDVATSSTSELPSNPEPSVFSMGGLIEQLQSMDDYRDQIVPDGHRTFPEHLAEYGICIILTLLTGIGELSRTLSTELSAALQSARGISRVYSHQAKAINDLWDNKNVIVSTSTASGKSLIYQVPVLDALEKDPDTKALYIFPTKALAQDQKKSLVNILSHMKHLSHIMVETFDGDTPQADRNKIREEASGIRT